MSRIRLERPQPNRGLLVADRARARFFTIDSPEDVSGPVLVEHADLVNPESALTRAERSSDRRSGRHETELDRRFAREIAARARDFAYDLRIGRIVVVVAPRFLGVLRSELASALPQRVALSEITADLTWHTPARIRAVLEMHDIVRPSALPDIAYRPRAQHPSAKRGARPVQRRV